LELFDLSRALVCIPEEGGGENKDILTSKGHRVKKLHWGEVYILATIYSMSRKK